MPVEKKKGQPVKYSRSRFKIGVTLKIGMFLE